MTVQNALEEMKGRAFAPAFQKYLLDTYKVLAQTDFSEEEKDYTAAEDYFTTTLEQSENEILSQIKTNYEAKLRYASQYAFNAGLYSGFVQRFSNQDLVVDGFEKHLMQDLFEMPGMQRHTLFLKMHDENKKLIEQLEIDGDEERREHLTSIECAWEQRVHWAACHSFYCGYRAAVKVLTAVEGVSTFDMVPHTLLLEYHLGYTKSYDDVYQQLALRLIKAVAGYDPEKGRLEQHIFAQLKYELLSCRSAYRLCGMTGTPHSFRKSHIISIDALYEDSSLYEEALAA